MERRESTRRRVQLSVCVGTALALASVPVVMMPTMAKAEVQNAAASEPGATNNNSQKNASSDATPRARLGTIAAPEMDGDRSSRIALDSQVKIENSPSREDQAAMSIAAGRLLSHVEKARNALNQNNSGDAGQQIDKAMTLARIIKENAPSYRIDTTIRSGDQQYKDADTYQPAIVPVYSETTQMSLLLPIVNAKNEANGQHQDARSSETHPGSADQTSGKQSTEPSAQKPAVVSDVAMASTSIYLDANSAGDLLRQAKQQIDQNNLTQANRTLGMLQQNVYLSFAEVDMPLVEARENLALARAYANSDRTDAARKALTTAANALDQYARGMDGDRADEIKQIRQDVVSARKDLDSTGQHDVDKKLNSLWQRLSEWQA